MASTYMILILGLITLLLLGGSSGYFLFSHG